MGKMSLTKDKNQIGERFYELIIIMISITLFFSLGFSIIDIPGLYYDEVLFVNASLGKLDGAFIYKSIFDIPLMVMPYIGALKAWIYTPIFYFFGMNILSVRLPMLIIATVTLLLHYIIVKKLFNKTISIIFILLISVDHGILLHSTFDWGPVALMMLIRALLILSLLKYFDTYQYRYLVLAIMLSFLGVFDKANFIWNIVALAGTIVIVYPRILYKNYKIILVLTIILIGIIGVLTSQLHITKQFVTGDFVVRFLYLKSLLLQTISGESVFNLMSAVNNISGNSEYYKNIINTNNEVFHIYNNLFISALGISTIGIAIMFFKKIFVRQTLLLFIFSLLIGIQIFITKKATGSHHLIMLAPIWYIYISVGLYGLCNYLKNRYYFIILPALIISLFIFSSILINQKFSLIFSKSISPKWEKSSTKLVKLLSEKHIKTIVCTDWGIGNILSGQLKTIQVNDYWPQFTKPLDKNLISWYTNEFINKTTVFVVPAEGKASIPQTRKNFLFADKQNNWNLKKTNTIYGIDNKPWYEIYQAK